jgi:hypothetical protein
MSFVIGRATSTYADCIAMDSLALLLASTIMFLAKIFRECSASVWFFCLSHFLRHWPVERIECASQSVE